MISPEWRLSPGPLRRKCEDLIARYKVKTFADDSPIQALSGEMSGDVDVLIVAKACFGFVSALVAEIRAQIMDQRNRCAAVLLLNQDRDEVRDLSDRVAMMSVGTITHVAAVAETDRAAVGKHVAGHERCGSLRT